MYAWVYIIKFASVDYMCKNLCASIDCARTCALSVPACVHVYDKSS